MVEIEAAGLLDACHAPRGEAPGDDQPGHDHAWRRQANGTEPRLAIGQYRCDLCAAVWSM